ncbi:MAG: segregation/condensation protein A [Gammaproteobacteria bacterium]|nr:segregation/condensation protein A [Gammaproteobacteria bacterium]
MNDEIQEQAVASTTPSASDDYAVPDDLFIPPDALIVILEAFEGPLDLLLYLIRRKNLDILDIPVAEVTEQYMAYIDVLTSLRLELAGDYLVMAATLAELKSRMLLPRKSDEAEEEEDPRAELVRRLLEYEVFQKAAEEIDELPRVDRDIFIAQVDRSDVPVEIDPPKVELRELLIAFTEVLERDKMRRPHPIDIESLSIRERMTNLLTQLANRDGYVSFLELFDHTESREGAVVTLLALLELIRDSVVSVIQHGSYEPIFVTRAHSSG